MSCLAIHCTWIVRPSSVTFPPGHAKSRNDPTSVLWSFIFLWKLFFFSCSKRNTLWELVFCVGRFYSSGWKWSPVGRSESGSNSPVLFGLLSISHVGMRHTCDNHGRSGGRSGDSKQMFKIENILWTFWNFSHRPGSIGRNLKVAVRVASNGNPRPVVRDQVFVPAFQVTLFR